MTAAVPSMPPFETRRQWRESFDGHRTEPIRVGDRVTFTIPLTPTSTTGTVLDTYTSDDGTVSYLVRYGSPAQSVWKQDVEAVTT